MSCFSGTMPHGVRAISSLTLGLRALAAVDDRVHLLQARRHALRLERGRHDQPDVGVADLEHPGLDRVDQGEALGQRRLGRGQGVLLQGRQDGCIVAHELVDLGQERQALGHRRLLVMAVGFEFVTAGQDEHRTRHGFPFMLY